jgi:riboflavin kinase/FMN adenylyltransferase
VKRKTAVALGTFDGVHKGHCAVLDLPQNCYKAVVTFHCPPKAVFSGEKELIMSVEDRFSKLYSMGIDEIFAMDFNSVKDMGAKSFLDFINSKYNPSLISCGFNYRFGKNGEGDVAELEAYCSANGIEYRCAKPVKTGEVPISSSIIRQLLKAGDIETATELLGEPFSFAAEVIHGQRRGRTIGFPTVNQKYPEELVRLRFGVYKTKVDFNGEEYYGITNIGIRPTFESDFVICETYIKDFSGDLYGKKLRITPLEFLREEKKFDSLEELKKQIEKDLEE